MKRSLISHVGLFVFSTAVFVLLFMTKPAVLASVVGVVSSEKASAIFEIASAD